MKIDNTLVLMNASTPNPKVTLSENDRKLKEQTDAFEAFFIKKIFDISIKSEHKLFGKDAGDKIYQSMYHDAISKELAGGFGYSALLFNYLKENR